MTDNKENRQGQGGGPKTVLGKVSSSKNAVTHGVTSKQLLNPDEERKFHLTLQEFEQNYNVNHPLVKLQIERIAQTQIQLQRVQKMMLVQYQKSQLNSQIDEDLQKAMGFDADTADLKLLRDIDPDYRNYDYITKIAVEIFVIKQQEVLTHEDVLNKMPQFIKHITAEAKTVNQDLHSYIKSELEHKRRLKRPGIVLKIIPPGHTEEDIVPPQNINDIVKDYSIEDWQDFILIKQLEIHKSMTMERKINDYQKLLPLMQEASLPDLDTYDKLMRYQTSLNNQLSKQIGELVELEKTYAK
jgi:hypothetical protein